jgi:hypothetical protein
LLNVQLVEGLKGGNPITEMTLPKLDNLPRWLIDARKNITKCRADRINTNTVGLLEVSIIKWKNLCQNYRMKYS